MELAGDEKRIQALFCELSCEDACVAPRFENVWREALVAERAPRPRGSLVLKVAAAATVIAAITMLFVASFREQSPPPQNAQHIAPQPKSVTLPAPQPPEPENRVAQRRKHSYSRRPRALARRQQLKPELAQQAALLANWKSPTENLMTAPTQSAFGSLPQLNESVKDLQSFLSKESNQ
jgi:hypothetical protein